MGDYIHELTEWPAFRWDDRRLASPLAAARHLQGRLIGRMEALGFEVAEQLGWRLPGQYVAPMASGSSLTKINKAFGELVSAGLVDSSPWRVFGAQSAGCAPIASAYLAGTSEVVPLQSGSCCLATCSICPYADGLTPPG